MTFFFLGFATVSHGGGVEAEERSVGGEKRQRGARGAVIVWGGREREGEGERERGRGRASTGVVLTYCLHQEVTAAPRISLARPSLEPTLG